MFFVVLLLMYASSAAANGSDCCQKVMGSCRSACEQLYMDAIADLETKQQRLLDVKNFCSSSLSQFWNCINETQTKGDSKTWKSCCNHAVTDLCNNGCEIAESTTDLVQHCRKSDEMYLFDCVAIKQEREECCGLARKPECLNLCRRWVISPSQVSRNLLANMCSSNVINCLGTLVPRVPLREPHKYLHCCEHSNNIPSCKEACRSSLKKQANVDLDRLQENLNDAGCPGVSMHDRMWQCFLKGNDDPPIGNLEDPKPMHTVQRSTEKKKPPSRAGVNDAKLHCCKKAVSNHCKKLCFKIFTNEFDWQAFEKSCWSLQEENMNQCLDEVTEPCQPGCKDLKFCNLFNNRPLQLFRSCSKDSDNAARDDYKTWVRDKKIILPNMEPIYLKNIEECSPITWKALACALQLKPCDRQSQSTRICRTTCVKLLEVCLDESEFPSSSPKDRKEKIDDVCNKMAAPDETGCVSLDPFLEQMGENAVAEYTTPCADDTDCRPGTFCKVRHHCHQENEGCEQKKDCVPGCPVGQVAAYLVPTDAYVPIPTHVSGKNCFKICQCKTRINECESLYCIQQDYCTVHSETDIVTSDTTEVPSSYTSTQRHWTTTFSSGTTNEIPSTRNWNTPSAMSSSTRNPHTSLQHGSTLYIKCNLCICYGGEITCSKRNCNETLIDVSEPSFFRLPCNCDPVYEPVCTKSGLTLQNECIARCFGYKHIPGQCISQNTCESVTRERECPNCVSDHKVCLPSSEKDCQQHQCVATSGCKYFPEDPVCSEEGKTYRNLCAMSQARGTLAYHGPCLSAMLECNNSVVCGVDGNTYPSECHAIARYISVDYSGPCRAIGVINNATGEIEGCPADLECPALPAATTCALFIPPGACCPICAGAIRVLYSKKQIERSNRALNSRGSSEFTVEKIMKSLSRHVDVAECAIYGHLTMENDLIVLVKSNLKTPTELQLQICALEAEKLAVLIQRGSPRIATDLSTSILVYAKVVHYEYQVPGSADSIRVTTFLLYVSGCLILLADQ
ncbi:protein with kazal [Nesidiocoris tenuis]|uniref:Protein with kazal n=1 Tax=Nesidiocoris tenuis TaxID=355587 RepID=A0ABN7AQM7_9HEMI|nr:protein with kazal [Nesidiocoris tenuis]